MSPWKLMIHAKEVTRCEPSDDLETNRVMCEDNWNSTEDPAFPPDLRAWMDESTLICIVLNGVQSACELGDTSRTLTTHFSAGQPRVLLTILTYCYAVGIYASEEIEARIPTDPSLRYLSVGARPTWHDLRRFRRQERKALHKALNRVLYLSRGFRSCSIAEMLRIDAAWCDQLLGSCGTDSTQTLLADLAANYRINQSVLRDSMALDE